jgi:DNA-directed RNA polymerase specialized sigma24 family protein
LANLPLLSEAQWDELLERLTLHAHRKYLRLIWRGVPGTQGGRAPGGLEPADFAAQAILDVIEGRRTWNGEEGPAFLTFLMGVVDSKLSHLCRSVENRVARVSDPAAHDGPELQGLACSESPPEQTSAEMEELARLQAAIAREIEEDPIAVRVLECLKADVIKPVAIASRLGINVRHVYNAQRRLRHKIETVLRNL